MSMTIKKGDEVLVIAGREKGKKGKVSQILPAGGLVVVDGVNKRVRHLKTQQQGKPGQRIDYFAPLRRDNLMLLCPSCGKPTRVGHTMEGDTKKRVCKKCKKTIA